VTFERVAHGQARRGARTDRLRTAALLWGGSLLVTGAVFSLMAGIIHPYYTVAPAPAIATLVAITDVQHWPAAARPLPDGVEEFPVEREPGQVIGELRGVPSGRAVVGGGDHPPVEAVGRARARHAQASRWIRPAGHRPGAGRPGRGGRRESGRTR
jgi:hypothetical protein